MTSKTKLFSLLLVFGMAACDSGSDTSDGGGNGGAGGKADDTENIECAPLEELTIELVGRDANESSDGDRLTNSVTATCFNNTGFENAACCAEAGLFDAYEAATSCPEQVVLRSPEGNASLQRCADSATGAFVASACCADICDPDARLNAAGRCIDSGGRFEDSLCCFLANALDSDAYEQPEWDTVTIGGEDRTVCRDKATGRFAMNSACAAACVQAISDEEFGVGNIPAACEAAVDLVAPEAECPDLSTENSAGICHNPENGQFVKAACCEAKGGDALQCSFDKTPPFDHGDTGTLFDALDPDALHLFGNDGVSDEDFDVIAATGLHLGFLLPGQESDRDAVLGWADDLGESTYWISRGELDGDSFTAVSILVGDTEVGVVLDVAGDIVSEISDGDLIGCG
jgi:hypothetical protein